MTPCLYMVFDVESIGLHGEGYAVGWVLVDARGRELSAVCLSCPPETAIGEDNGREWVSANVPPLNQTHSNPCAMREGFWARWMDAKRGGAILLADCAWPVEARFLAACVDDKPSRCWEGPYPLHDIATARLVEGFDPLATVERLPNELPEHDPLADARQSARLWLEALRWSGRE